MARISEQPVAQPLTGNEEFVAVQDGGNVKVTPEQLLEYNNDGILTGRVTKTIDTSGGDFTSFDELFDWISHTPMISVDLTVLVQVGTYTIPEPVGSPPTTYTLLGSQLTKIHIVGVDEHNCILNINNSVTSKGFIKATNMYLGMSRLTINNLGQPAFVADVTSSTLNFNNLRVNDVEFMFTANRSHCETNDCYITCTASGFRVTESSTLEWGGGDIDGGGTAPIGIYCWSNSTMISNGTATIRNTGTGLVVGDASRVMMNPGYTFIGNTTDFNIPLNIFQGDGGYISDGNLDISGSSDAFELIANKNQPSGYAGLDSGGKIPAGLLPDDEVLEYSNLASFPATGVAATIYISLDTGILYRWGLAQTGPSTWENQYINITDGGDF